MIINDFNIFGASSCPPEADAPLPVYSDTVLPSSIALERFQPITGRYPQVFKIRSNLKLSQFPAGNSGDACESLDAVSLEKDLGIGALEGSDHLKL